MLSKRSLRAGESQLTPSAAINLVVVTAIAVCLLIILVVLNQRAQGTGSIVPSFHPISYRDC